MRVLTFQSTVTITLRCDSCENFIKVVGVSSVANSFQQLESKTKREAKYDYMDKGWSFKSEGAKGVRHFCPECMKKPELVAWKMERVLTGKDR